MTTGTGGIFFAFVILTGQKFLADIRAEMRFFGNFGTFWNGLFGILNHITKYI